MEYKHKITFLFKNKNFIGLTFPKHFRFDLTYLMVENTLNRCEEIAGKFNNEFSVNFSEFLSFQSAFPVSCPGFFLSFYLCFFF